MTHRVLIADDEAGMRLLLRKAIEKHPGFAVCAQAQNGEEALELFEKQRPDVVFLDVEMPVLDGIETARRLQDTSPDTPIVFVTAHEAYRSEAFEVYAADYLVKPFSIERLDADAGAPFPMDRRARRGKDAARAGRLAEAVAHSDQRARRGGDAVL